MRLIGVAAGLVALGAFVYTFSRVLSVREAIEMLRLHKSAICLALVLYLTAYVPMTAGWVILAKGCGAHTTNRSLARVYLVSQIGKYLPGNVGHFLGRVFLVRQHGVSIEAAGAAITYEIIGSLASGALFAMLVEFLSPPGPGNAVIPLAAAALASVLLIALLFLRRETARLHALNALAAAVVCYFLVCFLMAGANIALLGAISGNYSEALALRTAGAVVLSSLLGFMVPGAPAGLGIREMSFYALLAGSYPASDVVLAAAAMRLVTTAGDGIAWLVGLTVQTREADVDCDSSTSTSRSQAATPVRSKKKKSANDVLSRS